MSREELQELQDLSPERFDRREWVALQWVRCYLACDGQIPDPSLTAEFHGFYSDRERTCVFAVFKLMFFFNMLANTAFRERFAEGDACVIKKRHPD